MTERDLTTLLRELHDALASNESLGDDDQALAAIVVSRKGGGRLECEDGDPILRRSHERDRTIGTQLDRKGAGTPQLAARVVASLGLGLIANLADVPAFMREA